MPFFDYAGKQVYYDYQRNEGPAIVFINGLTQSTQHWNEYKNYFSKNGMSILCFDVPGQGQSETPDSRLSFGDISCVIGDLMGALDIPKAYFIGLSFGATIALHFAVRNPQRVVGMVAIGGHSEKDTLFKCIHQALIDAVSKGGIAYLFDFLSALNFTHEWIEKNKRILLVAKQICVANNEDTAIRYFLETILENPDITDQLHRIECPVLIMCGENDVFTPRWCQEILRENIPNSSMILMQNVCHAFTIESPRLSKQLFAWFIQQVQDKSWVGDQAAWIALDQGAEKFKLIPCKRKK